MAEAYIGEIRMFAFPFAPRAWAACDGQIMAINQNQALFSLLGTYFGGNGTTTFALPDLRGCTPVHVGNNGQGWQVPWAQRGGQATHVLTPAEMPMHTHTVSASNQTPTLTTPASNTWATSGSAEVLPYGKTPDKTLVQASISSAGSSQAHENRQPYLPVNFCICLYGYYPSRQ